MEFTDRVLIRRSLANRM